MKKIIMIYVLAFIFIFPFGFSAKERRGADLLIEKLDRGKFRGELIAVAKNSLILMDRFSGADFAVKNNEIKLIK